MNYSALVSTPRRSVASFLLLAIISWIIGPFNFTANAASLRWVSDTLSDTATSSVSNHTIVFTTPTGITAGQTFTIEFDPTDNAFDLSAVDESDIDIATTTDDGLTIVAGAPGENQWGYAIANDIMTFTAGAGVVVDANGTTTVQIGTNAAGGAANAQITNPDGSQASLAYIIRIGGTMADSADTRVLLLQHVEVTAAVETIFEFEVTGLSAGSTINTDADTTAADATAVTLPFGILTPGTAKTMGQALSVKTNATHGYAVTVQADGHLLSATGADINPFIEDADTPVPTAWVAPVPVIDDQRTFGHEGITSEDSDLNSNEFGDALYAGNFVDAPRVVLSHDKPVTWTNPGDNPDKATTRVGYKIEINEMQEAATDYHQSLHYVATPTF